jgi:hypothetical protein
MNYVIHVQQDLFIFEPHLEPYVNNIQIQVANHGTQFYRFYLGENWAKFEAVEKEYVGDLLKDEELKHDTVITREQLELLEKHRIKL